MSILTISISSISYFRLALSFGKSSPTNMELNPLVTTLEHQSSNWKGSTFITMRRLEANTFQGLSFWIWNLVPWIQLELDLTEQSLDPTTLFSDNQELETIGPKDITLKVNSKKYLRSTYSTVKAFRYLSQLFWVKFFDHLILTEQ